MARALLYLSPLPRGAGISSRGAGGQGQIASPASTALPQPRGSPRALLGALQFVSRAAGRSAASLFARVLVLLRALQAVQLLLFVVTSQGRWQQPQQHKEPRARGSSCLCRAPAEVVGRILHTQSPRMWGMVIKKPGEQCLTLSKCFLVVIQRSKENPEENTW